MSGSMTASEKEFAERRRRLAESLMADGYLTKKEVIDAVLKVPRHWFVPARIRENAYGDYPLSIGESQTISAPHMVSIMCERLDLAPGYRVLEIGTGSGYHAAVVAEIIGPAGHVYTVERIARLADSARENIRKCGLAERVTVVVGDGSGGYPENAPYDRIYVTAASPGIPEPLLGQLKEGGKMLVPAGSRHYQELLGVWKKGGRTIQENYGGCVFVPLIGEHGHREMFLQ